MAQRYLFVDIYSLISKHIHNICKYKNSHYIPPSCKLVSTSIFLYVCMKTIFIPLNLWHANNANIQQQGDDAELYEAGIGSEPVALMLMMMVSHTNVTASIACCGAV